MRAEHCRIDIPEGYSNLVCCDFCFFQTFDPSRLEMHLINEHTNFDVNGNTDDYVPFKIPKDFRVEHVEPVFKPPQTMNEQINDVLEGLNKLEIATKDTLNKWRG